MQITEQHRSIFLRLKKYSIWLLGVPSLVALLSFFYFSGGTPKYSYQATIKMGQLTNVKGEDTKAFQTTPLVGILELRTFLMSTFSKQSRGLKDSYLLGVNEYSVDGLNSFILAIHADSSDRANALVTEIKAELEERYGGQYDQFIKTQSVRLEQAEEILSANKKLQSLVSRMDSERSKDREDRLALALIGRSLLSMELKKTVYEMENAKMSIEAKYSFPFSLLGVQQTSLTTVRSKIYALVAGVWLVSLGVMMILVLSFDALQARSKIL
jgi:hypothetical protein